jgi:hypothetical protein
VGCKFCYSPCYNTWIKLLVLSITHLSNSSGLARVADFRARGGTRNLSPSIFNLQGQAAPEPRAAEPPGPWPDASGEILAHVFCQWAGQPESSCMTRSRCHPVPVRTTDHDDSEARGLGGGGHWHKKTTRRAQVPHDASTNFKLKATGSGSPKLRHLQVGHAAS